ncbi:MAG TPA: multicopper oxidase domain-containing protein [Gemmatimonadaceae bacterium]|nr:multicopper oxidase domain-containing protein [Gemmatimonadaceae bacterium]
MHRHALYAALFPLAFFNAGPLTAPGPLPISPNDNRQSAGTLENGVLTVRLETRTGLWRPEGEQGRAVEVAAFAEEGKAPSSPGPLIRVRTGTEVRVRLHNTYEKPLTVFGFGKAQGLPYSAIIAPHATADLSFKATAAGTFFYKASRSDDPLSRTASEDQQLNGAIVVDPPNGSPPDRVLVISWWSVVDSTSPSGLARSTMAINGLSWPHTERLDYTQGDSVHWRVINLSDLDHPMHLHGFYFRLDAKGDGVTDSLYTRDQQRMEVTEVISPFTTIALSWQAERPGNWIFHCHYATHISSIAALDMDKGVLDESMLQHHASDRPHQMYGLVLGIRVASRGMLAPSLETPRAIRLLVREKPRVYGDQAGFSFVMGGTSDEANPVAMPVPGPTLILERGKPVAITIVNKSTDRAAVHWHGIELESYPDGVPGWSGAGNNMLPSIGPGDSLTVRFTPPRAGTFMYHSHFNEAHQISGGLYGPIIVVEPGERFDPARDKLLFFGTAGFGANPVFGPFPQFLLNGETQPAPMNLEVGRRYRFRLLNLAGDMPLVVSLNSGTAPVTWRPVAKDGYPLPPSQAVPRSATLLFEPGEIYDFEYTPEVAGDLTLTFGPTQPPPGSPPPPPIFSPLPPVVTVQVHVR